ncbi:MAG: glycosyltransferase [Candidatus Andersenbacteria bacterium]|nr:glycosyltransferase [Candidatus Andersenbacteria bacterium]
MIPQTRKYFVVTVHFGAHAPTDGLVASLLQGTSQPHKVVIIDHAEQAYALSSRADLIHIIRPQQNNGYAGGLNLGLGALTSMGANAQDIVICLNNDASLAPSSLEQMKTWADKQAGLYLAGPVMGRLNYISGRTHLFPKSLPSSSWTQAMYVHGSCLIAPMQVYANAKGLPEHFFMYWEDVAFSARAVATGARLKRIPNLTVTHPDDHPVSSGQVFYLVRNGAWYLEHHTPGLWRIYWYLLNRLRYVWHIIAGKPSVATALKAARQNKLETMSS